MTTDKTADPALVFKPPHTASPASGIIPFRPGEMAERLKAAVC
jgi:hypothetical protein